MAETVGIFGAGALGSFLASRLSHAGHLVHVLARSPARAETLRRAHPNLRVESSAPGLAPATLILFCVKSYDTEDAARTLAGADVGSAVASLQNGWGHMETHRRALPKSPLVAGTTSLGAYFDPHDALHGSAEGSTWFAPWGETDVRWAEYAAMLFQSAGLRAEATRDAPGILWRKLMLNAAVNPVSALFGLRNGDILESKEALRSAEAAASEAARVGARLGYLDARVAPVARLHEILRDTAENRSSMAEDLARGRRTEVDDIVGAVVRAARDVGEPVPELTRLWDEIRRQEEAGRPDRPPRP
ncbi:MAG: ketopantoate reductase family protein [Candidatus Eiseniibacteriota bacterium]